MNKIFRQFRTQIRTFGGENDLSSDIASKRPVFAKEIKGF